MGKLLAAVLLAALLWSGYWFFGAHAARLGVEHWFEARRAEGWAADYADLSVWGFPNRFDVTLDDVALGDPETGLAWTAPFFQVFALSYRPQHLIAVWPDRQVVETPLERITVETADMRASAVFDPGDAFTLDHGNVVLDAVALRSSAGWTATAERLLFALRRSGAGEARYQVGVEADGIAPAPELLALLDPVAALPDRVETLRLDATIAFDRPWDRAALEVGRPQPREVRLTDLHARWGEIELRAGGALTVDAAGIPEGRIEVQARNWREVLRIAVATGALPGAFAPALERGLEALAGLSGRDETLDLPLDFEGGRVSLGPLPLGPAPRLVLR